MLKKRKHKFMAFLLSAMMLITGTTMGAAPAAAAEKSPPDTVASMYSSRLRLRISRSAFDTSDRRRVDFRRFLPCQTVAGHLMDKKQAASCSDLEDTGSNYRLLPTPTSRSYIGEGFTDTTATCVISADGYSRSDADAEQVRPYSDGRDRRNCTDIQDHDGSHNTRHRNCRPDIRQKRGHGHDHSSTGYRLLAEVAHSCGQQRKKYFHHGFQVSDAGFRRDDKCCV